MPSPPMASTASPSSSMLTVSTVSNWVRVNTTSATRSCMERLPPPDSNAPERSTVASPSTMSTPSSSVPSGISVVMPMSVSNASGPAKSSVSAPRATAGASTVRPAVPTYSFQAK